MSNRLSFGSILLLGAASSRIVFAQDNVCISKPNRFGSSMEQIFPSFSVPCPAVGERVVVGLSYQAPPRGASQLITAVSHEGAMPIEGISVGRGSPSYEGMCEDISDTWDGYFFNGEGKDFCLEEDKVRLCTLASQYTRYAVQFIDISVWNSGGCEGNILFQAKVYETSASNDKTEINCLTGMEVICEDLPPGTAGPYFNSTAAEIELATENVCETVDETKRHIEQIFPSLTVPCPAIGERVNAAMRFRHPLGIGTSVAVAARHEGDRPAVGISLGHSSQRDGDCDDLESNFDDFFHKGQPDDGDGFCRGSSLSGDGRLCEAGPIVGTAFEENEIIFSVWNDGAVKEIFFWKLSFRIGLEEQQLVCPVLSSLVLK